MTSFIELPRLTFHGQPRESIYVNVADIIALEAVYDGQTNVMVRELGSQGVGIIQTYAPLAALLDALGMLAEHHGARSWVDSTKEAWARPVANMLSSAYARERADWKQGAS